MINLTALHYKLSVQALEKFHNIKEHNEGLLFKWESTLERNKSLGVDKYPKKPFIEPFEFEDSDYIIKEKKFRTRLEDIFVYKENEGNTTELTTSDGVTITVKETVEEIDKFFE